MALEESKEGKGGKPSMTNVSELSKKQEKRAIIKNLLFISFGFMGLYSAFNSLSNIQSSLNSEAGLGLASLSVINGFVVLSCLFTPTYVIKRLGCKWTMVVCMLLYTPYFAANFYPRFYTLCPTAVLVGLAAAPMLSAKSSYLSELATRYSEIVGQPRDDVLVRFFGVHFIIFQTNQLWGNLISSFVLNPGSSSDVRVDPAQADLCGGQYCNEPLGYVSPAVTVFSNASENPYVQSTITSNQQVYLLCGIYLSLGFLAALFIAVFVSNWKYSKLEVQRESIGHQAGATFRLMLNPRMMFLIPITIFTGMKQAYFSGDFSKAFVTCTFGIQFVGFVMMTNGVVDVLACLVFSFLSKYTGRLAMILLATLITTTTVFIMLFWMPTSDQFEMLFVISGIWGMAEAIWQTQVNALYGYLFFGSQAAGFSNYRMWNAVGYLVGYSWSTLLCVDVKLYSVWGLCLTGFAGCCAIEILVRNDKRREYSSIPDS